MPLVHRTGKAGARLSPKSGYRLVCARPDSAAVRGQLLRQEKDEASPERFAVDSLNLPSFSVLPGSEGFLFSGLPRAWSLNQYPFRLIAEQTKDQTMKLASARLACPLRAGSFVPSIARSQFATGVSALHAGQRRQLQLQRSDRRIRRAISGHAGATLEARSIRLTPPYLSSQYVGLGVRWFAHAGFGTPDSQRSTRPSPSALIYYLWPLRF